LANLGHRLSDQTVGNILRRHGLSPAPKRKQTVSWKDFIRSHRDVLVGMDFFTAEVLTLKGLLTYYVLFFIHLETRRVSLAGFTPYPDQEWMEQQARNLTMEQWGCLRGCRYVLHDRDTKFCESFRELIASGSVKPIRLPARSPNLNSYAERWVRSVKEECLAKLIYLESHRCGEPCSSICCITMKSGTIRARKIAYCFLFRRRQEGKREQCSAGND
jgi:putative transposase